MLSLLLYFCISLISPVTNNEETSTSVPLTRIGSTKNLTACKWQSEECHTWDMVFIFIMTDNIGEQLFNYSRTVIHNITKYCNLAPDGDRAKFYTVEQTGDKPWCVTEEEFGEQLDDEATYPNSTIRLQPDLHDESIAVTLYASLGDLINSGSSGRGRAISIISNGFHLATEIKSMLEFQSYTLKNIAKYGISAVRILDLPLTQDHVSRRKPSLGYANLTDFVYLADNYDHLEQYVSLLVPCSKPKGKPKEPTNTVIIVLASALVGFLILLVAFLCFCQWYRKRKYDRSMRVARLLQLSHQNNMAIWVANSLTNTPVAEHKDLSLNLFLDQKWELPRSELRIYYEEKLGSGSFCHVYRGVAIGAIPSNDTVQSLYISGHEEIEVAVKMLHEFKENMTEDLIQEIRFMKTLGYHRHLLNMVACVTVGKPVCILIEYCSNGDLLQFIKERKTELGKGSNEAAEQWNEIMSFAWQISDGMVYLSSRGYVHRDLAARNILIDASKTAKVGDYGLCRRMESGIYTTHGGRLPIKWMAIESLANYEFSAKTDVWSFGVLLYEIFSLGRTPYPGIQPADMMEHLQNGNRLPKTLHCPDKIYSLMTQCWNGSPSDRPTFEKIETI